MPPSLPSPPKLSLPSLRALVLAAALAGGGGAVRDAAAGKPPQVKMHQEPIPAAAGLEWAPDQAEAGSAAAIAALTGSLRLLPPSVAYLPDDPKVPSPTHFFGHLAGDPAVVGAADVTAYLRALAAATPRVRVVALGTSEEGREIVAAIVSEAHNLTEAGSLQAAAARLADPRQTPAGEAARLAETGKVCVHLVGGRRGDLASPEMLVELAYRLAVSQRDDVRSVRENALVVITVVADPDAYQRAVEWDRSTQARQHGGGSWEDLQEILTPPYGGHYGGAVWADTGDAGLGLAATRAFAAAFWRFRPQLVVAIGGGGAPLLALGEPPAPDAGAKRWRGGGGGAGGGAIVGGGTKPGADPWPDLATAVVEKLRGMGLAGVLGGSGDVHPGGDSAFAGATNAGGDGDAAPDNGAPEVALALDYGAVAGVVRVFGNAAAGSFERAVGVLERSAGGQAAAAGGAAAGGKARAAGRSASPAVRAAATAGAGPWPPEGKLAWSLRDSVNYGESAVLEALIWAAAHRGALLAGTWQRAVEAREPAASAVGEAAPAATVARPRDDPAQPVAWLASPRQSDPARLAALVTRLLAHHIEVQRLTAALVADGRRWPANSYVVRFDQPLAASARRDLGALGAGLAAAMAATKAEEPDAAVTAQAIEEASQAVANDPVPWPLLFGVRGAVVDDAAILAAAMVRVTRAPLPEGRILDLPAAHDSVAGGAAASLAPPPAAGGAGPAIAPPSPPPPPAPAPERTGQVFLLRDTGQTSLLAARLSLAEFQIDVAEAPFQADGRSYAAGSWIVQAPRARVEAVARRFGLTFAACASLPEVARHVIFLPRLGVLHGWTGTEPSGWVRWRLDHAAVPYRLIADEDLRRGSLHERFDVILLAGAGLGPTAWPQGLSGRWSPLAYVRTAGAPSLGLPDGAADITGGVGVAGLAQLRRFVEEGGVLAAFGDAAAQVADAEGFVGPPPASVGDEVSSVAKADTPPGKSFDSGLVASSVAAHSGSGDGPAAAVAELRAFFSRADHPLAYGFSRTTQVMQRGSARLQLPPAQRTAVVLHFGAADRAAGDATAPGILDETTGDDDLTATQNAAPATPAERIEVEDIGAPKPADPASSVEANGVDSPGGEAAGGASAAISASAANASSGAAAEAAPGASGTSDPLGLPPAPLGSLDGRRLRLAGTLSPAATAAIAALRGAAAVADLPLGRGHLVLFSFDPFDPADGPGDQRLIDNLLLNWHALPPAPQ